MDLVLSETFMNNKETILKYFSQMDIDMLEVVIDDSTIYYGVKQDVFLRKVNGVFEEFKKFGDSELEIHNGECGLKSCNFGNKGYCFMGNHSRRYINLIFLESGNEVTDIRTCSEFITDVPEVISMGGLSLIFGIDEKVEFYASHWYLTILEACNRALKELPLDDSLNLPKENYLLWLKKYKHIYEEMEMPFDYYKGFEEFKTRYYKIQTLASS